MQKVGFTFFNIKLYTNKTFKLYYFREDLKTGNNKASEILKYINILFI